MSRQIETTIADAAARNLSVSATIELLADVELESRNGHAIERRFKLSRLQTQASIDAFHFHHHKSRVQAKNRILRLLDLAFLKQGTNLVLIGNLYRGLPPVKNLLYRKYKNQLVKKAWLNRVYKKIWKRPVQNYQYEDVIPFLTSQKKYDYDCYPCVIPNWDNSARSGVNSMILNNSTPQLFGRHLDDALELVKERPDDKKIVFIKSWNEWAEGNHLEPDRKFGTQYLEVVKQRLSADL